VDGRWHKVRVRLREGDYQLSYRRGYFDDGGGAPKTPNVGPGQTPPMRTVLRADGSKVQVPQDQSIPIVFEAQVLPATGVSTANGAKPPKRGESAYVVRYELPAKEIYPATVAGNEAKDKMGTAELAFDRYGEAVARRMEQVSFEVNQTVEQAVAHPVVRFDQPVNLRWGDDYLLAAVWDETSGRMGMVSMEVNVPKPPRHGAAK